MRTRTFLLALISALVVGASLVAPQPAHAVYPNPFFSGQTVQFQLSMPKAAKIKIQVFDLLGRPIKVLVPEGEHPEGNFDIPWKGDDESGSWVLPGVYICVLFSDGVAVKSVMVVKIVFQ